MIGGEISKRDKYITRVPATTAATTQELNARQTGVLGSFCGASVSAPCSVTQNSALRAFAHATQA